jgi:putative oxidoreductase
MTARRKKAMSLVKTLGHALLAGTFISGGANTFINPDVRAAKVEQAGIPLARQATIINGAVMVVAGTALAVGFLPKVAAVALLGSLIPTTLVGHPFWQEQTPQGRTNQQIHFNKNLSMLGGLLVVLFEED